MPQITISEEAHKHLLTFVRVGQALSDEPKTPDELAELLMLFGIRQTLEGLWASLEPATLIEQFHQLTAKHPAEMYAFVADTLERGDAINRDSLRGKFGF